MPRSRRTTRRAGQNQVFKPPIDPRALARVLRMRKAGALILALLIIVAISVLDRAGGVLPVADDWRRYHDQEFEVARVIDGDTIELRVADRDKATTKVRLWGVDTPEVAKTGSSEPAEPWADEATAFTRERLEGKEVTLILQRHRLRGGYGRLLAYVILPDGSDLSAQLIEQGYSKHDDRWSHDRSEAYAALELRARRAGRGIWSD